MENESDPEDDDDDDDDEDCVKVTPKAGYGMKTKAISTQSSVVDLIRAEVKPAEGGVGTL